MTEKKKQNNRERESTKKPREKCVSVKETNLLEFGVDGL